MPSLEDIQLVDKCVRHNLLSHDRSNTRDDYSKHCSKHSGQNKNEMYELPRFWDDRVIRVALIE